MVGGEGGAGGTAAGLTSAAVRSGYDAWVAGDEPVVVVDWWGASNYARD